MTPRRRGGTGAEDAGAEGRQDAADSHVVRRTNPGRLVQNRDPFELIAATLQGLPEEAVLTDHSRRLSKAFTRLASQLSASDSAYRDWAERFHEIADAMSDLPTKQNLRPFLANKDLQLHAHSNERVAKALRSLLDGSLAKSRDGCDAAMLALRGEILTWSTLTKSWLRLRPVAAAGIRPIDLSGAHGGPRPHGETTVFVDRKTLQPFTWYSWTTFMWAPDLLAQLAAIIVQELADLEVTFDTVCALSFSGLPVAANLARMKWERGDEVHLMAYDAQHGTLLPDDCVATMRCEKILAVDSVIQTGSRLAAVMRKLGGGAEMVGAVTTCLNDILLPDSEVCPELKDFRDRRRLAPIFLVSDLYALFKKGIRTEGARGVSEVAPTELVQLTTFFSELHRNPDRPERRQESLKNQFRDLAGVWESETALLSSVSAITSHPAYLRIIGLGPDVVPLIVDRLRTAPGHWFAALRALSGTDPAADEETVAGAIRKWLEWADKAGASRAS